MTVKRSSSILIIIPVIMATLVTLCSAQTQNYVAKFNASSGTTNSSIFDNGNVGIGTTNPGSQLDIVRAGAQFRLSSDNSAFASFYQEPTSPCCGRLQLFPGPASNLILFGQPVTSPVRITFTRDNGGGNWAESYIGYTDSSNQLQFLSNGGQVQLINGTGLYSSGNVGIGTPGPTQRLQLTSGWIGIPSNSAYNYVPSSFQRGSGGLILASSQNSDGSGWAWGSREIVYDYGDGLNYEIDNLNNSTWSNSSLVVSGRTGRIGNVGIGTISPTAKLEVNGSMKITSGSGGGVTFSDGTNQVTAWTGVLCGGDYAESVTVNRQNTQYEPGDVIVIDSANPGSFVKSSMPYAKTVAGIYSTKPGVVGKRSVDPKITNSEIPMAMIGIVPTKVTAENGPIQIGDLLVTSSTPGRAMKGTDAGRITGAIVGKALGSLSGGNGVIDALVTLQ